MTEKHPEAGFNRRRPSQDPWVTSLLEKHGLAPDASLEEIKPKAKDLWGDASTRTDAVELVLGRRIDASESDHNHNLAMVMFTVDPSEAFAGLQMLKTLEELQDERQQ